MAVVNICGQLSSDCSTIDRISDPALINARKAFPSAQPHAKILAAKNNLLSCLAASSAGQGRTMIVGHGEAGTIVTGSGPVANDQDKKISVTNTQIWKPLLQDLAGHTTELTFCSCDTGADEDGANLLMEAARTVGAEVSGFTAQIFIDATGKITCEAGGVWQHAHPNKPLPSVPAPIYKFGKIVVLRLKYGDQYQTVKTNDVLAASFLDLKRQGKHVFLLEGEAAQQLVSTVNFSEPSEISGAPLALNTGILKIEYMIDGKRDVRAFLIHNDRLLFDQSTPNTFYFASPDFAATLAGFRFTSDKSGATLT